jgi:cell division protein FtsX
MVALKLWIRLGLRPWKNHAWIQTWSAVSLGVLVFTALFLMWFGESLKPQIARLVDAPELSIFFEPKLTSSEVQVLVEKIRQKFPESRTELLKPEQVVAQLLRQYPELSRAGIEGESDLLPAVAKVEVTRPSQDFREKLGEIRALSGVESVENSADQLIPVWKTLRTVQWLHQAGAILLLLVGGLCLVLLNRLHQRVHAESVQVLRSLGYPRGRLILPSLISALGTGVLAASISLGLWWTLSKRIAGRISEISPYFHSMERPEGWLGLLGSALSVGLAVLLSIGSSRRGETSH